MTATTVEIDLREKEKGLAEMTRTLRTRFCRDRPDVMSGRKTKNPKVPNGREPKPYNFRAEATPRGPPGSSPK